MTKLFPVLELGFLGQCLISLNKVVPPTLNFVFLALKLFHINFVWVVLFAESAIRFPDGLSVE